MGLGDGRVLGRFESIRGEDFLLFILFYAFHPFSSPRHFDMVDAILDGNCDPAPC